MNSVFIRRIVASPAWCSEMTWCSCEKCEKAKKTESTFVARSTLRRPSSRSTRASAPRRASCIRNGSSWSVRWARAAILAVAFTFTVSPRRTALALLAIGLSPNIVHYGGRFYRSKRNHTLPPPTSQTQSKSMRNFSVPELHGHWLLGEEEAEEE